MILTSISSPGFEKWPTISRLTGEGVVVKIKVRELIGAKSFVTKTCDFVLEGLNSTGFGFQPDFDLYKNFMFTYDIRTSNFNPYFCEKASSTQ